MYIFKQQFKGRNVAKKVDNIFPLLNFPYSIGTFPRMAHIHPIPPSNINHT